MLTRSSVRRIAAAACIGALSFAAAAPAHATTNRDRIAATARAVDATAKRWFAAQAEAARIDASIADVQHRITATESDIARLRKIATARAVVLYKNADLGMTTYFGDSAIDSARRAHLADDANAEGDQAIARLEASVDELHAQQRDLQQQRRDQQRALADVAGQRRTLDAQLAAVRAQAAHDAAVALAAARTEAARQSARARLRALAAARHPSDALAAPTGAPLGGAPVRLTASPNRGRVSPHHDDPFLVCTRVRESAGQYDAVSPSGYYGAYQFLPSTWDSTAVHAGRGDLVGVLPSRASEYDQDELAWSLYQWQGNAPWGGRC